MSHIPDFLHGLRRPPALRMRLPENLSAGEEVQMTIGAFLLTFDFPGQRAAAACADPT